MSPGRRGEADNEFLESKKGPAFWPQRLAVSNSGMVAAQHPRATEAGVAMLEAGGNAVDAAVAAAFALGVCEPAASGLGGQTLMMIYIAESRRTVALDGSSRAPLATDARKLRQNELLRGYRATTVPSTPAALGYALERYGTLPLAKVLEPAIGLADEGYAITALQRALLRRERRHLRKGTAGRFFLRDDRKTYRRGTIFRQPALAGTLRRLSSAGIEDFYKGEIARRIVEDMSARGGLITARDLAEVPWPVERKPISCRLGGMRVATFPPPGAGRALAEMLNIAAALPDELRNMDSAPGAVAMARVMHRAFLDRDDRPFDPDTYPDVERKKMLSAEYADMRAEEIIRTCEEGGETTHLSAMDSDGNVVSLTQSIERVFGSCSATEGLGFLYNDYMSAFERKNPRHPYFLKPGAVPWSSVAPSIAFRARKPVLAIGSPGSARIATAIFQVLLRLKRQSPLEAVSAPRLHCSLDGTVSYEASRMRTDIPPALERAGFKLDPRDPFSFYMGCVQLVLRNGEEFVGVADPRRDGSAQGPA